MKDFEVLDDKMLENVVGGLVDTDTTEGYILWSDLLHDIQSKIMEYDLNGNKSAYLKLLEAHKRCRMYCDRHMKMSGPVKALLDALNELSNTDPSYAQFIPRIRELL